MSISVEALSKTFGTQKAIDNISFEIKPGNVVGFLGPNGAGKSTTMKILSCFIPASSGKASVCGYDVAKESLKVRQNLGYLPEKNPLYADMYVREFLQFTANIYQLGKQAKSRVAEMINLTGLEKEMHKKIGTLSKGYKQRVGLAQAMIHHPKALILDEPTSGLDPNQIVAIRELIKNISSETTVLLSTHIMQEVQAMCNRVIIINSGKIVADDKIDTLNKKQSATQQETGLIVEWEQEIKEELLTKIENITSLKALSPTRWLFKTQHPEQLRKAILNWSVNNGLDIISLQKEQQSLEDTFRELTKKE